SLTSVLLTGEEERDLALVAGRYDARCEDTGAPLELAGLVEFPTALDIIEFEHPHGRVIVVEHLPLGGLTDQLGIGRGDRERCISDQFPLRGCLHRDTEPLLESLDTIEWKARSVLQQRDHGCGGFVVLGMAHAGGWSGRE